MLIPSVGLAVGLEVSSLSRRVNANSQPQAALAADMGKLIKKGEC